MRKIKILHSEPKDYCPKARAILDSFADVDYLNIGRKGILQKIAAYDALIIRLKNAVDRQMIQKGRHLKAIACATTGTDHIDERAARDSRIRIISLKGETKMLKSVHSTAEHAFGLMLALLRKIPVAQEDVLQGRWQNERFRGHELFGKTLGIIGFGRLGSMAAKIAGGFGMTVLAYDKEPKKRYPKNVRYAPLDQLLAHSDIVTLHIPFNEQTKNFMNAGRLKQMKKGAYLINTSRGTVLDERSLLGLLKNGHLAGAALDVLTGEERSDFDVSRHPLVRYARRHQNVIITPHIGGAALEAVERTDEFIAQKLKAYFTHHGTK